MSQMYTQIQTHFKMNRKTTFDYLGGGMHFFLSMPGCNGISRIANADEEINLNLSLYSTAFRQILSQSGKSRNISSFSPLDTSRRRSIYFQFCEFEYALKPRFAYQHCTITRSAMNNQQMLKISLTCTLLTFQGQR